MPLAFVLINTEMGSMEETLKALNKISNVKEAYMVYGSYDLKRFRQNLSVRGARALR